MEYINNKFSFKDLNLISKFLYFSQLVYFNIQYFIFKLIKKLHFNYFHFKITDLICFYYFQAKKLIIIFILINVQLKIYFPYLLIFILFNY